MTLKIAVNSVIRGASSWLSLIVASVVLMVVVTLSIGLIVAGVAAGGDAQQAYASMGGDRICLLPTGRGHLCAPATT